jgi:hypothetical protein
MKIHAYLTDRSLPLTFDNAGLLRNPEFPNWVDVVRLPSGGPRGNDKILAMLPVGTAIIVEREPE